MDNNWLERTSLLLGEDKLQLLQRANVLVVGLGGVGAYAAEMLARAGVGRIHIVDKDVVDVTNINRQILATHHTVGMEKSDAAAQRVKSIHPDCVVHALHKFYGPDTAAEFDAVK